MRASLLLALVVALGTVLAGCITIQSPPPPVVEEPLPTDSPPTSLRVACAIVDENRTPLTAGSCTFRFGRYLEAVPVDRNGTATRNVPAGLTGTLSASAPGRVSQQVSLTVEEPKAVRFVLAKLAPGQKPTTFTVPATPTGTESPDVPIVPVAGRSWKPAVAVQSDASGGEPHLTVAADGTVYYAPASSLHRSTDGGKTFQVVTPTLPDALPVIASDTSVHVAADQSLWWSAYWAYPGTTMGCTSTDRGDSWTCDNLAIPPVTDRMWIAGVSSTVGYLQSNVGLYHHVWAETTTGSTKYTPYATTTTLLAVRNGNMQVDTAHGDKVWQVEFVGDTSRLIRVDGGEGLVTTRDIPVPAPYALPWLAIHNGTFWTTGEKDGKVMAARSMDEGATWDLFPVSVAPAFATFSYIAAGPDGRVALVYYGSDKAGESSANGGKWSLYVAETDNGLDPEPTWVETQLVADIHEGNLCIGLNCEGSGGDPDARFAGDLIGIAMDVEGNAHVAYVRDAGGSFPNEYRRQARS